MNKTAAVSSIFLSAWILSLMQITAQARSATFRFERAVFMQKSCVTKISKEEMEMLLKDANPVILKSFANDPELKKKQIENIKELFALACQAVKEGFADDSKVKRELEDIRIELLAAGYDREINKDKVSNPPFSGISEDRVKEFYLKPDNLNEFKEFINAKIALAKESKQIPEDYQPKDEEIAQAKQYFAKTRIYAAESKENLGKLPPDFSRKVEFTIKLQEAQYLSKLYAQKVLEGKTQAADEEIRTYIADRPEFDTNVKKAKAEKILQRAKSGEDFAKLAKEFSEDPGSKDSGGLYENVPQGVMIREFEQAALSLTDGQIYSSPVETNYGYHIIKLEKKETSKNKEGKEVATYSVRHILISTTVKDPDNPMARDMPLMDYVKNKITAEKEKKLLDKIIKENPIEVAEDFQIPNVSDEQTQQTSQRQSEKKNKTLPKFIKNHLDRLYKGWKLSPTEKDCAASAEDVNNGIVEGNFNGDKKPDYAVKFTRGKRSYIIAFLALTKGYKAFVLHNYSDADEVKYLSLGIWEKGKTYETEDRSIVLKYDAPSDFRCESDVGGIHLYQNGKFTAY